MSVARGQHLGGGKVTEGVHLSKVRRNRPLCRVSWEAGGVDMGYSLFCQAQRRRHLISDSEVTIFLLLQSFLRVYKPRSCSEITLRESPPFYALLHPSQCARCAREYDLGNWVVAATDELPSLNEWLRRSACCRCTKVLSRVCSTPSANQQRLHQRP